MQYCLETIKVQNKKFHNLSYHQARLARTRRALFAAKDDLELAAVVAIPNDLSDDIYKCRIIYDAVIQSVEFQPYQIKPVQSLQLVAADDLKYAFKYADRSAFAQLLQKCTADDILIVKNGFLTDTSYANIVFWEGNRWITPATPLLAGTQRQRLLDQQQIFARKLRPEDLQQFMHARLINAMLDMDTAPTIPIHQIY